MLNPSPLVSIITPTFNHEMYIGACIDSVLQQTYTNWEQIVIDDGSTDHTADIVRSYSDSRIRYFHQDNLGIEALARTYNHALSMSKGELVAILEGDDLWPPDKLSAMTPAFAVQGIGLAYGAVADVAVDGAWSGRLNRSVRNRLRLPPEILHNNPPGSVTRYMAHADGVDLVPPSTAVIRRCALDSIGGFQYVPGLCVTDFPTFLSLSLAGPFSFIPRVLGYRRRHSQSATFQNLERIIDAAHQFAERFISEHDITLTREEREAIDMSWAKAASGLEFTRGRLSLSARNWRQARTHFSKAMDLSQPRFFAAATAGWLFSWTHNDLESLARMIGIASLRSR